MTRTKETTTTSTQYAVRRSSRSARCRGSSGSDKRDSIVDRAPSGTALLRPAIVLIPHDGARLFSGSAPTSRAKTMMRFAAL